MMFDDLEMNGLTMKDPTDSGQMFESPGSRTGEANTQFGG